MQIQINVFLNPFVYCLFILSPNAFVKIAFILNIYFFNYIAIFIYIFNCGKCKYSNLYLSVCKVTYFIICLY